MEDKEDIIDHSYEQEDGISSGAPAIKIKDHQYSVCDATDCTNDEYELLLDVCIGGCPSSFFVFGKTCGSSGFNLIGTAYLVNSSTKEYALRQCGDFVPKDFLGNYFDMMIACTYNNPPLSTLSATCDGSNSSCEFYYELIWSGTGVPVRTCDPFITCEQ